MDGCLANYFRRDLASQKTVYCLKTGILRTTRPTEPGKVILAEETTQMQPSNRIMNPLSHPFHRTLLPTPQPLRRRALDCFITAVTTSISRSTSQSFHNNAPILKDLGPKIDCANTAETASLLSEEDNQDHTEDITADERVCSLSMLPTDVADELLSAVLVCMLTHSNPAAARAGSGLQGGIVQADALCRYCQDEIQPPGHTHGPFDDRHGVWTQLIGPLLLQNPSRLELSFQGSEGVCGDCVSALLAYLDEPPCTHCAWEGQRIRELRLHAAPPLLLESLLVPLPSKPPPPPGRWWGVQSLSLKGCAWLREEVVLGGCLGEQGPRMPALTALDLTGCVQLTDACVEAVLQGYGVGLQELWLGGLRLLTWRSWLALTSLPPKPALTYLSLRACTTITSPPKSALLTPPQQQQEEEEEGACWPSLMGVDVSGVSGLSEASLYAVLQPVAHHLTSLLLAEASITDTGLQALLQHRSAPYARACDALVELDVSWCEGLTAQRLTSLLTHHCGPSLAHLALQCCSLPAPQPQSPLVPPACRLHSLNLTRAHVEMGEGEGGLLSLFPPPCLSTLTLLDLSWCSLPHTPHDLLSVIRCCLLLQHLSLQGSKASLCPLSSVWALVACLPPSLRFLDCSWCDEVSEDVAMRISRDRPRVLVVDYYCTAYVAGRAQGDMGDGHTRDKLTRLVL